MPRPLEDKGFDINHPWSLLTITELQQRGEFWKYHYDRTTDPLLKERIINMFNSFMDQTRSERVSSAT